MIKNGSVEGQEDNGGSKTCLFGFALSISTIIVTRVAFSHPSQIELFLSQTDMLLAVTTSSDFLCFPYSRAPWCPALPLAHSSTYCAAKYSNFTIISRTDYKLHFRMLATFRSFVPI